MLRYFVSPEYKPHDIYALLVRIFWVLENAVLDHLLEHEGSLIHTRYIAKMKLRRYCFSIASKIPFSYDIQTRETMCDHRVTKQANKIIKQPIGLGRPTASDGRNGKAICTG